MELSENRYQTWGLYRPSTIWRFPEMGVPQKQHLFFRLGFSTLKHPAIKGYPHDHGNPQKKKLPRGPDVAWRAWKRTIRCWTDVPRWCATAATRPPAAEPPMGISWVFPSEWWLRILHQLIGGLSMFIPLRLWIFIGFQPSKVKDFAIFRNHPLMLNQWWMDLG